MTKHRNSPGVNAGSARVPGNTTESAPERGPGVTIEERHRLAECYAFFKAAKYRPAVPGEIRQHDIETAEVEIECILRDVAVIGGHVISTEAGRKLESVTKEDLGHARRIEVAKEHTTLIGGSGNAASGTYGDMVEMGVLDPTKVARHALLNAASVAALILTTDCMVAEKPKNTQPDEFAAG